MSQIGQQIERLRIKLRMNQTEFGTLLGVSAMAISRWERSVNPPEARELLRLGLLAREFGVDGWSFWGLAGLSRADARAMMPRAQHGSRRSKSAITCPSPAASALPEAPRQPAAG